MIDRIQQLTEQARSAKIARSALEKAAFRTPDHGLVCALLEARAAEESCNAELQKALWIVNTEIAA